jgi:hypothetical protein
LKIFITAVMVGHQEASSDRSFYSNMLLGPHAIKRVGLYRDACRQKFGHFDAKSLGLLTSRQKITLEDRLLNSEHTFGSFIVGYKLRFPGSALDELYATQEHQLDPTWLAIEPSYLPILTRHISDQDGSQEQRRHRFSVCQAVHELKHNKKMAAYVFKTRQDVLPLVVQKVLGHHGLSAGGFEIEEKPVDDVAQFWSRLGLAIQHYYILRYLDGDQSAEKFLRTP